MASRHLKVDSRGVTLEQPTLFSCKDCVDALRAFLDGEMSGDDEAHLRSHLAECPPCLDFLETYKATPGMCRKALARQMPEELSLKLKVFLREKAGRS